MPLRKLRSGGPSLVVTALAAVAMTMTGGPTAAQSLGRAPLRDPGALSGGPAAWASKQRERSDSRRHRAVADMRARLALPPGQLEAQQQRVRSLARAQARHSFGHFDRALADLLRALSGAQARGLSAEQRSHRLRQIRAHRQWLRDTVRDLPRLAALERERLRAQGASAVALRRHDAFFEEIMPRARRLSAALNELPVDGSGLEVARQRLAALSEALGFRAATGTGITRMPSDPIEHSEAAPTPGRLQQLPQRRPYRPSDGALTPRGGPFQLLNAALERVAASLLAALPTTAVAPTLLQAPDAADLAPTASAPHSAEITALAESLGHDPLRIYHHVLNTVDSEVYYGSLKGASGTLAEGAGNDADQASLLVALLRASGVPARYEYGIVALPIDLAREIANVDEDRALGQVFASQGVPGRLLYDANTRKATQLLLEHIWVRAHVPYEDYRGHDLGAGEGKRWVSLDPYLKRYDIDGGEHFQHTLPADTPFFDDYLSGRQSRTPTEKWFDQIVADVRAGGRECDTPLTLTRRRRIRTVRSELLPELPPVEIVHTDGTFDDIPPALQHSLIVALRDRNGRELIRYELDMPEAYGRSIGVGYPAATPADQATIDAHGGLFETPAYLLRLAPAIYDDGVEVARGDSLVPGVRQQIDIVYGTPDVEGYRWTPISHRSARVGGAYSALVGHGQVPASVFAKHSALLAQLREDGASDTVVDIQLGQVIGLDYYQRVSRATDAMTAAAGYVWTHDPFEGLGGRRVVAEHTVFGRPVGIASLGQFLDIKLTGLHMHPVDGRRDFDRRVAKFFGFEGSNAEHLAIEAQTGVEAISTIKALQLANEAGQGFVDVDLSNLDAVLGQVDLHPDDEADIARYVRMGRVGRIPLGEVTLNDWRGAGYFLLYPHSDWGCYLISGGLMGGHQSALYDEEDDGPLDLGPGDSNDCCSGTCGPAGSVVNLSSGTYFFHQLDLESAAPGGSIPFVRSYRSSGVPDLGLGVGFSFSLGARLEALVDGSLRLRQGDGRQFLFAPDGAGGFEAPPGHHNTLRSDAGDWLLESPTGTYWRFSAPEGRLISAGDRNGEDISLQYQGTQLTTVRDRNARALYTLTWDSGHIQRIETPDGRAVELAYDADRLVEVTDVRGFPSVYAYDGDGRLISKTPAGTGTTVIRYDSRGRFDHSVNPVGGIRRALYDPANRRAAISNPLDRFSVFTYDASGHPTELYDPLGNLTRATWDADGNRLSVQSAAGVVGTMSWDDRGRLQTYDGPSGHIEYRYDPLLGRRTEVEDDVGLRWRRGYDANGNLTSEDDATGGGTTYTRGAFGRLEQAQDVGRAPGSFAYHPVFGRPASYTDPAGGTTLFDFDSAGRVRSITDPMGHATTLELDAAGAPTRVENAEGEILVKVYDEAGRLVTERDADGLEQQWRYDAAGRLVERVDWRGASARFEYDAAGQLTAEIDASGDRTEMRYDALGRLVELRSADGAVTSMGYCADFAPTCSTCATARAGSPGCQETVDATGALWRVEYDARGQVVRTTDPTGAVVERSYDARGQLLTLADTRGESRSYAYDLAGRLTVVTDALGGELRYEYDVSGDLVAFVNAAGDRTTLEYDVAGRRTRILRPIDDAGDPEAGLHYGYDLNGNITSRRSPGEQATIFTYDGNRRVITVTPPGRPASHFEYDTRGRLRREHNAAVDRHYDYDAGGLLLRSEDHLLGKALQYEYDPLGKRTQMSLLESLAPGASVSEVVRYSYDAAGHLSRIASESLGEFRFTHDAVGRRTSARYPSGLWTQRRYDPAGRLESLRTLGSDGTLVDAIEYELGPGGQRVAKTRLGHGRERYDYDPLLRLRGIEAPNRSRVDYEFDAAGNRLLRRRSTLRGPETTTEYRYDGFDRLECYGPSAQTDLDCSEFGNAKVVHDLRGNLTSELRYVESSCSVAEGADGDCDGIADLADGCPGVHSNADDDDQDAVPDACDPCRLGAPADCLGRCDDADGDGFGAAGNGGCALRGIDCDDADPLRHPGALELPDGLDNDCDGRVDELQPQLLTAEYGLEGRIERLSFPGMQDVELSYDPSGEVAQRVQGAELQRFLYDGGDPIAAFDASGARVGLALHGPAIDELLGELRDGAPRYFGQDASGSVTLVSDAEGQRLGTFSQAPFGATMGWGDEALESDLRFSGRPLVASAAAGVWNFRRRFYNSEVGRFMSADPVSEVTDSRHATMLALPSRPELLAANRYSYVSNDPINFTDPLGLWRLSPCMRIALEREGFGLDITRLNLRRSPYNVPSTNAFVGGPGSGLASFQATNAIFFMEDDFVELANWDDIGTLAHELQHVEDMKTMTFQVYWDAYNEESRRLKKAGLSGYTAYIAHFYEQKAIIRSDKVRGSMESTYGSTSEICKHFGGGSTACDPDPNEPPSLPRINLP